MDAPPGRFDVEAAAVPNLKKAYGRHARTESDDLAQLGIAPHVHVKGGQRRTEFGQGGAQPILGLAALL